MTSVLIQLAGFEEGTFYVEDDGIPDNGIVQLRTPSGSIIYFNIPTEFLTITASAGRSVVFNLTESFGAADITVGNLANAAENPDFIQVETIAGAGDVVLVSNGAITESNADTAPDIVATTLILSAATGVGTGADAFETQVQALEAETTTGGINISNIGNIVVGGLTDDVNGLDVDTSGDLKLTSFGSITLSDESPGGFESVHGGNTSGNVTLIANGFDSDITSNVDQDAIVAQGGNILLQAGRDISFGTAGVNFDNDVRANGSLTLLPGRDLNIDGFADFASDGFGAATGGGVSVVAGRDINILNTTGTDGSLGAEGSGGGDVSLMTGSGGFVRLLAASGSALFSNSGDVTVNADRMTIGAASGISTLNGVTTLNPATGGWAIDLGSLTDAAFALELSDPEIDRLFADLVIFGGNNAGPVTVSSALTFGATVPEVIIRSGTNISLNASITTPTALSLRALDNVFQLAGTVTTGSFTVFADAVDDDAGVGGIAMLNGTVTAGVGTIIRGNLDNDTLHGSGAAEFFQSFAGNDTLRGFGGADSLDGGSGNDTMAGGLGDDIFYADVFSDVVAEAVGEGSDRVQALNSYTLNAGSEIEILESTNISGTAAQNLSGNEFGQTITGNNGVNILEGFDGNDVLNGNGGADYLSGGTGNDTMDGGSGDDVYFVDSLLDVVNEVVGFGNDRIATSITFTLNGGTSIETLETVSLSDTTAINLTGNSFNQTINGNNGVNVLNGGGGSDVLVAAGGDDFLVGNAAAATQMQGGTGNDTFYVSHAGDVVTEASGAGTDRVAASVSYTLTAGAHVELLEAADLASVTVLGLAGNELAQTVTGNAGNNRLNGRGGNDILQGLGGNDTLIFNTALGAGNVDQILAFVTAADKIELENAIFTGLAAGALPASAFKIGAAANEADDRIVYNSGTGALFFDADGDGAGAAVQFATLVGAPALAASDFVVV